jgi:toxin ParE1/3/4
MKYQVRIVAEAEDDIVDIYQYVLMQNGRERANHVLRKLRQVCASLATLPHRGHVPPELQRVGVCDYLETHFKPYRIIYEVADKKVFVHCVLDGRRDIQELLERRLLR